MMQNSPLVDISVIIGSFNQKDRLKRVIDGFCSQKTNLKFELITTLNLSLKEYSLFKILYSL